MPSHSISRTHAPAIWLLVCCAMVFVMALLGAITRLTESGLSITDWSPILGAIPPLNEADWDKAFSAYQQIPQYQIVNQGMSLEDFQQIYFWEWLHRLWGRLIALVFAAPLIWFALRKEIDHALGWKLAGILALIGFQGFVGWYMVQSGLAGRTDVAPYRLALHLAFALVIYGCMLWQALGLMALGGALRPSVFLRRQGWITVGMLALTMVWGALVAGLHAGEAYNTWPLMDGAFFPSAALTLRPVWINAFDNLAFVQFIHRWLGPMTIVAILVWIARYARFDHGHPFWLLALGGMGLLQVALGLSTLLSHANIVFAVLHQAGAILLLSLMLVNLKRLSPAPKL